MGPSHGGAVSVDWRGCSPGQCAVCHGVLAVPGFPTDFSKVIDEPAARLGLQAKHVVLSPFTMRVFERIVLWITFICCLISKPKGHVFQVLFLELQRPHVYFKQKEKGKNCIFRKSLPKQGL